LPSISSTDVVRTYLESMLAAETGFEARLRGFLSDTADDVDLRAVFLSHADNARTRTERLQARAAQISGAAQGSSIFSHLAELAATLKSRGSVPEERTVQDLVMAFQIHSSECAMSEVLATVAAASSDSETESLARQIQEQAKQSAARVFSLIRSRTKIAFNMLTLTERDPAVETKMADDRVI
jgi:hypothetical protein